MTSSEDLISTHIDNVSRAAKILADNGITLHYDLNDSIYYKLDIETEYEVNDVESNTIFDAFKDHCEQENIDFHDHIDKTITYVLNNDALKPYNYGDEYYFYDIKITPPTIKIRIKYKEIFYSDLINYSSSEIESFTEKIVSIINCFYRTVAQNLL